MRLSVRPDSPYFSPLSRRAYVLLDGLLIADCYEADEENGLVWCIRRDRRHRPWLTRERDAFRTVVRCGRVKIVIRGEH